ncbi:MAG: hypothetical protein JW880_03635 [Candidatus Thermoplasmatota archaeon]|nr:hypothetical protein [Candidatus Thermoplasmatota archaeon]
MKAMRAARDPRLAAALVVLVSVALISAISWGSERTSAGSGPKNVRGYVWDSAGIPVPGANATVRMYNGAVLVDTQYYDATEPDGFYTVTFGFDKWYEDYTIELTATSGIYTDVNSTTAVEGKPYQWVNATLGFLVPEFGQGMMAGLTVASFLAMAAVLLARRRGSR